MTEQRIRDLRALAKDPAASPAEARAARAAAERIAERLRGRQRRQVRALRTVAATVAAAPGPWDVSGGVPGEPAPVRSVDASTSSPDGAPTVEVHHEYGRRTTQAAPYWCGACGQGRNHAGPCPKCHGRVTEV